MNTKLVKLFSRWFILGAILSFIYHGALICFAEDILLDLSAPVSNDKHLLVATFLRNEPNYYYFTVAYRLQGKIFYHYKTRLSFTMDTAAQIHNRMLLWLNQVMKGQILLTEDPLIVCPIDTTILPKEISP